MIYKHKFRGWRTGEGSAYCVFSGPCDATTGLCSAISVNKLAVAVQPYDALPMGLT